MSTTLLLDLPDEVLRRVAACLDVEARVQLGRACRRLQRLLLPESFFKQELKQQYGLALQVWHSTTAHRACPLRAADSSLTATSTQTDASEGDVYCLTVVARVSLPVAAECVPNDHHPAPPA